MVPRAHWKGFLKLSLVSCPVALYPAVAASERISFRQVNKQTGNRLRHQLVDAVTGEPVRADNKGRGYEVGENEFVVVADEELAAAEQEARSRPFSSAPTKTLIHREEKQRPADLSVPRNDAPSSPTKNIPRLRDEQLVHPAEPPTPDLTPASASSAPPAPIQNNRTIAIDRFIPRAQVDPRYLDTPYYVVPRDEVGAEAFAVIRDAMRAKDVVGMGRVVLARRERPIIVEPMGNGIRGMTLRYSHEIRDEANYFSEIQNLNLPEEMLRVAEHIVETKIADFDPAFLEDRYRTVLISNLKVKRAAMAKLPAPAVPAAQNVISLMNVLKRSLAAEQPATRTRTSPSKPRVRAAASSGSRARRSSSGTQKNG